MTAQVIYLNQFLNCSDDELRRNYLMQDKINEAKAKFWYDMSEMGVTKYQADLCYDRFIHANRDRLKLVDKDQSQDDKSEGVIS